MTPSHQMLFVLNSKGNMIPAKCEWPANGPAWRVATRALPMTSQRNPGLASIKGCSRSALSGKCCCHRLSVIIYNAKCTYRLPAMWHRTGDRDHSCRGDGHPARHRRWCRRGFLRGEIHACKTKVGSISHAYCHSLNWSSDHYVQT